MTEAPPRAIEDFPAYSYRDDPAVPANPDQKALIVFDGICVMCNALARFVAARDSKDEFLFTEAQSPLDQALFRHYGLNHTGACHSSSSWSPMAREKSGGADSPVVR